MDHIPTRYLVCCQLNQFIVERMQIEFMLGAGGSIIFVSTSYSLVRMLLGMIPPVHVFDLLDQQNGYCFVSNSGLLCN